MHTKRSIAPLNLQHLADCQASSKEVNVDILRRSFGESRLARVLFHELGKKMSLQMFFANVEERIDALEFQDFNLLEKTSFETLMRNDVEQLKESGVKAGAGKDSALTFLNRKFVMTFPDLNDDWQYRYTPRSKTTSVSLHSSPRWLWEIALFENNKIPGCRETVKVPSELLMKINSAREVGLELIKGETKLSEMRRVLTNSSKLLLQLDPSMRLYFEFLNVAFELLEKKVKCETLAALPTESEPLTFAAPLSVSEDVWMSVDVPLVDVNLLSEISEIISFARRLMNQDLPSYEEVSKLSGFYR